MLKIFLSEEKKQVEMRDVYLDFARELAETWKTLLDVGAPTDLIDSQESLIRQEIDRAWSGRALFSREEKAAVAQAVNGFSMDLLTGLPCEQHKAVP